MATMLIFKNNSLSGIILLIFLGRSIYFSYVCQTFFICLFHGVYGGEVISFATLHADG
jgi:hypothetical protein